MRIYRHFDAGTEVERLAKKYRTVWADIDRFERLLAAGVVNGHHEMPGLKLQRGELPASIWKARVICRALGKGKSGGLRYIYERFVMDGEEYAVGITV